MGLSCPVCICMPAGLTRTRQPMVSAGGDCCRRSARLGAAGYARSVEILEMGWRACCDNLRAALRELVRHAPGGSEGLFDVAIAAASAIERGTDELAEGTTTLARAIDAQAEQIAGGNETPRRRRSTRRSRTP